MINAIILNIKTFKRKKTFKNYMILNTIICILLFAVLSIWSYSYEQINLIINDENNRLIFIHDVDKINLINDFFDKYKEDIEKIDYSIDIIDYKIDDRLYRIMTNGEKQENDVIISSSNQKETINIEELKIYDVVYSDGLENDLILINQRISKYLIAKNIDGEKRISFYVNDYYRIDDVLNILEGMGIDCNANNVYSNEVETYNSVNKIVSFIFVFLIGVVIILIFVMNVNFLYEQKKEIMIYNNLGYDRFKMFLIYVFTFSFYLFLAYVYSLFIVFFFMLLLGRLDVFIIFLRFIFLPIVVIEIINLFVSLMVFLVKKKIIYRH